MASRLQVQGHNVFISTQNYATVLLYSVDYEYKHMPPPSNSPFCILLHVFCFSVVFACVCYTWNVINVITIGRQISELMFLWWPAILYSVLNYVCLLMANKWMMMMMMPTFFTQIYRPLPPLMFTGMGQKFEVCMASIFDTTRFWAEPPTRVLRWSKVQCTCNWNLKQARWAPRWLPASSRVYSSTDNGIGRPL